MKVPPKRKGNYVTMQRAAILPQTLNESPSEKEGKSIFHLSEHPIRPPSMKVPPKRKGNKSPVPVGTGLLPSMKVSPKRKGNRRIGGDSPRRKPPSMKVPPKRKGNPSCHGFLSGVRRPSMKVPPKRKGNSCFWTARRFGWLPQ